MMMLSFAIIAWASSKYLVTYGVKPGCTTGATITKLVSAESEIEACYKSQSHAFPYCCKAIKQ